MAAVIDFDNTDKNFDLVWCRGTLKEKIFELWMDSMRTRDCEFLYGRKVTDFVLTEETGSISDVVCGKEKYNADAVILAIGISILQELVKNRRIPAMVVVAAVVMRWWSFGLLLLRNRAGTNATTTIRTCIDCSCYNSAIDGTDLRGIASVTSERATAGANKQAVIMGSVTSFTSPSSTAIQLSPTTLDAKPCDGVVGRAFKTIDMLGSGGKSSN
ncbi:hypothetical protein LWI29_037638 [Acer saccharum]|uniref:Uncharacterized protein n=1 Tax=Acer saccharum TaxID=4024 RepID=A0AA39S201_ACESA|nr:hypothetical protein LWI29_037638 [Acer saccharum]